MSDIFGRNFNNVFEGMLSGSHVGFKKREHPLLSEQESELKRENERRLQEGIDILRKLRTLALEEQNPNTRQNILAEAHQFSAQMAETILNQALSDKPFPIDDSYLSDLEKKRKEHQSQDAGSGHAIPPQYSVQNLFRATDDMLVRIQEQVQSLQEPSHKLSQKETAYIIDNFLIGTNDLTIDAVEKFFNKDTKVGGILSGGSVYLELVKKIIKKYGDPSLEVNSFVIAVDKEKKKAISEASELDANTPTVVLTDDMIDRGGTMLTALWAVGEQFPNATIHSGKGIDYPGGFEKRRAEKHLNYLSRLFQDFGDLSEEGKNEEALAIFDQADKYARENNVNLQPGWHKRKERIERQQKE